MNSRLALRLLSLVLRGESDYRFQRATNTMRYGVPDPSGGRMQRVPSTTETLKIVRKSGVWI